jgi:hypothetical protein
MFKIFNEINKNHYKKKVLLLIKINKS